jgi:hypothetical protein
LADAPFDVFVADFADAPFERFAADFADAPFEDRGADFADAPFEDRGADFADAPFEDFAAAPLRAGAFADGFAGAFAGAGRSRSSSAVVPSVFTSRTPIEPSLAFRRSSERTLSAFSTLLASCVCTLTGF